MPVRGTCHEICIAQDRSMLDIHRRNDHFEGEWKTYRISILIATIRSSEVYSRMANKPAHRARRAALPCSQPRTFRRPLHHPLSSLILCALPMNTHLQQHVNVTSYLAGTGLPLASTARELRPRPYRTLRALQLLLGCPTSLLFVFVCLVAEWRAVSWRISLG